MTTYQDYLATQRMADESFQRKKPGRNFAKKYNGCLSDMYKVLEEPDKEPIFHNGALIYTITDVYHIRYKNISDNKIVILTFDDNNIIIHHQGGKNVVHTDDDAFKLLQEL